MFSAYEKMRGISPKVSDGFIHISENCPLLSLMFHMDEEDSETWVCTEKVHGCNFAFSVDLETMECTPARRSAFLVPDEVFFPGWKKVYSDYEGRCKKIAAKLKEGNEIAQVIIYGELFGGGYPGYRSVTKPIQTDLLYRPDMEFFAFDIATVDGKGKKTYLDYINMGFIFMESGFMHWAKPLYFGPLETAERFPVESFYSTVAITNDEVLIEGVVIRKLGDERSLVKVKAKRFMESWKSASKSRKTYVTEARLVNVISKIGPQLDEALLISELLNDIKNEDPTVDVNSLFSSALKLVRQKKEKWLRDYITADPD